MPSRKVRIMRVEDRNSHLPATILDTAKVRLSSVLKHQRPLSGLTAEEEREHMPEILGISSDHTEFSKQVRTFWADLSRNIPSDGTLLEIGTTSNGDPINLMDWVFYQWSKKHPLVSESREEAHSNPNKRFWVHDPKKEDRKENQQVKIRREAYKEFTKMSENESKMDLMLRVLTNQRPENMTLEQKENQLDVFLQNSPKHFIEKARDKNLELRGEILLMLEHEVLRKVGNQIMNVDEVIGDSIDEAIAWFKNKRNSSDVATLRAKLNEATR